MKTLMIDTALLNDHNTHNEWLIKKIDRLLQQVTEPFKLVLIRVLPNLNHLEDLLDQGYDVAKFRDDYAKQLLEQTSIFSSYFKGPCEEVVLREESYHENFLNFCLNYFDSKTNKQLVYFYKASKTKMFPAAPNLDKQTQLKYFTQYQSLESSDLIDHIAQIFNQKAAETSAFLPTRSKTSLADQLKQQKMKLKKPKNKKPRPALRIVVEDNRMVPGLPVLSKNSRNTFQKLHAIHIRKKTEEDADRLVDALNKRP